MPGPPLFSWTSRANDFVLEYQSERGLWQFAEGLLETCLKHYGDHQRIKEMIDLSGGAGTHVSFHLVAV